MGDDNKSRKIAPYIIGVKNLNSDTDINHFFDRFHKSDLCRDFGIYSLSPDVLREHIRQYITDRGLSSLFYSQLTCDAIMHPGFKIDDIEEIVLTTMGKLNGAKHLLIIDPYFYDDKADSLNLLQKIIASLSSELQKITIITNGNNSHARPIVHSIFTTSIPNIEITDVVTNKFHDRFWIDPDNSKGIVMGTSLNGIGKKIALIDHLRPSDTNDITCLALDIIKQPT